MIWIVLLATALASPGISGDAQEKAFEARMSACNRTAARAPAGPGLAVEVQQGGVMQFKQKLSTFCNAVEEKIRYEQKREKDNLIIIRMVFEAKTVSRCVCPREVTGIVRDLEPGEYKLQFVFDNRYSKTSSTIGTAGFSVPGKERP